MFNHQTEDTLGTQIENEDDVPEWGEEALAEQARERAALDAANAKRMQEQQQEKEKAAQKDYEEKVRQLTTRCDTGIISRDECDQLCNAAKKELDEEIDWGRSIVPGLIEVIK